MKLEDLGLNKELQNSFLKLGQDSYSIGRVIAEHKERYVVGTNVGELDARVAGKLIHSANNRSNFPAVGDWVAISVHDDNKASIHEILPRYSIIQRQAVGDKSEKQIIATNIDYGLIVQALDRDFNINRIERYLTICRTSGIEPIIVLSKADLISQEELADITSKTGERIKDVEVIAVSNQANFGYEELVPVIEKGKTYCLLGSSGVGKSTLINNLFGGKVMDTGEISTSTNKGRHVTSHRELVVLKNGGILIDNPGMREVGVSDDSGGLEATFNEITILAGQCRFKDCKHIKEKGCAVLAAIEEGTVSQATYDNYTKMQREVEHYESSVFERRKKDKAFGKMVKNAKNYKQNNIKNN